MRAEDVRKRTADRRCDCRAVLRLPSAHRRKIRDRQSREHSSIGARTRRVTGKNLWQMQLGNIEPIAWGVVMLEFAVKAGLEIEQQRRGKRFSISEHNPMPWNIDAPSFGIQFIVKEIRELPIEVVPGV